MTTRNESIAGPPVGGDDVFEALERARAAWLRRGSPSQTSAAIAPRTDHHQHAEPMALGARVGIPVNPPHWQEATERANDGDPPRLQRTGGAP